MKTRKTFLAALGAAGASLAVAARADAEATPSPAPSATASAPPSASALALAETMRRFDRKLTSADIAAIARGIDDNAKAAAAPAARKPALKNSDEPVATFAVPFP